MNLGDGLKLETQILNGRTKLILAPYGVQEKTSKQAGNRGRTQRTTLKVKQQPQIIHSVQNNSDKTDQPVQKPRSGNVGSALGKPITNVLKELENKKLIPIIQQNVQPTKLDAGKAKLMPKKTSNVPKPRTQPKPAITAEELRESLVCLTQEQFQQILMTINQNSKQILQEQTANKDADLQEPEDEHTTPLLNTKEEEEANSGFSKNDPLSVDQLKDVQTGSLFSNLAERERDKSLQEAKKAQWRRELDEQVALKKKLKDADQEGINFRHHGGIESSISERTPYSDLPKNSPLNDYDTPESMFKTSPGTETTDSSPVGRASSFSSPELPAAIRSAFIVGEATPLDHPFSAVKRQQQKKWLEELNKQREEVALRRIQEKQKIQEVEQQDLWAVHFDSFKKMADNRTPFYQNTANVQESESPSLSADPGPTERPQSSATSNLQQYQPATRMSTDEDLSQSQKAGFLRSMTALLDPAQIEERDRKRLKQLEHQKAIAAQVEEKRRRKQLEDEQRQREEQEQEQRLAREREQMQKQYEEDILRQKQKEEVVDLKTRGLYQSMQRAQEEAQRLKQEQRMRHLLQKGHDVSNLQKNAAGEFIHSELSRTANPTTDVQSEGSQSAANSVFQPSIKVLISPRRDTAVQTDDLDPGMKSESASYANKQSSRQVQNASPEIPIEFPYHQIKTNMQVKKIKPQRDRSESCKENATSDIYDQYARTEKQVGEPGRKPDWNRNKTQKKFVPASERYPKGLQKQREESKARRKMELLHLVEKNSSTARRSHSPEKSSVPQEEAKISHPSRAMRPALDAEKEETFQKPAPSYKRSESPPVPAVKNRLHQAQKRSNVTPAPTVYSENAVSTQINTTPDVENKQDADRPPSSQFVPYVRTKEIYYLDPDAPMSRPSTHDPQYRQTGADLESRQLFSSDHVRDPLLNPNVIRNKDRQQAILRGLSELRKGLLQKQRELESGLMPDV